MAIIEKTDSYRRAATLVGSLFLFSNVTFLVGAFVLLEPILSAPDYLTLASASSGQVVLGALLELANAVAYLGIATLVFPMLRRRFGSLALGYVALRILEFVMQSLSALSPLALLTISEEFVGAGAGPVSPLQAAGALLLAQRYWAFQMVSLTFGLGALVFYTMLYRSRLIPRFISVWGFVGAAIVLVNTGLDMFGVPPGNLGLVMLLNELFLGLWLIVKGFNPSAVLTAKTPPDGSQAEHPKPAPSAGV